MGRVCNFIIFHGGDFAWCPNLVYQNDKCMMVMMNESEFCTQNLHEAIVSLNYPEPSYRLWYASNLSDLEHKRPLCMSNLVDFKEESFNKINMHIFVEHLDIVHGGASTSRKQKMKHITYGPNKRKHCMSAGDVITGSVQDNVTELQLFHQLIQSLNEDQKDWVRELGFSSLLSLSITNIYSSFSLWITNKFNSDTFQLCIRENIVVDIQHDMVGWVLGIPSGEDRYYPSVVNKKTSEEMKLEYIRRKGCSIMKIDVLNKIKEEKTSMKKFQRHFLLYLLGAFFSPLQDNRINPEHLRAMGDLVHPSQVNWGGYILHALATYRRYHGTARCAIGGCTIFLTLFYLDRVRHGLPIIWTQEKKCRLLYWNQHNIDTAIRSDVKSSGDFGALEGINGVCYGLPFPQLDN